MPEYIKINGLTIEYGRVTDAPVIGECRQCRDELQMYDNIIDDKHGNLFCTKECYHQFNELMGFDIDIDLDDCEVVELCGY